MGRWRSCIAITIMATIKLKFVIEDIDRHGNVRRYFRRRGQRRSVFLVNLGRKNLTSSTARPLPATPTLLSSREPSRVARFGIFASCTTAAQPSRLSTPAHSLATASARSHLWQHASKPIALMQDKQRA